jgi:hypothetical protein
MDILIFFICCCCCCCISLLGGGFYYYTQYKTPLEEKKEMKEYIKILLKYAKEEKKILDEKGSLCIENNNKSCWDEINKTMDVFYEKFMKDIGEKKGVKININEKFDLKGKLDKFNKMKLSYMDMGRDEKGATEAAQAELLIIEKIRKEVIIKYIEKYAMEEEKILIQKYNKSIDLGDSCKENNHPCWAEMKILISNFYLEFYELALGINKDDKTYGNKSYGEEMTKDLKPDKKIDENNATVPQIKKIILGEHSYGSK